MPHAAARAILGWLPNDTEVCARALRPNALQIEELGIALKHDADDIYYTALVSFIDALNGLASGFFSWSTVKLYYVCFYAVRVILAANNVALFYVARDVDTGFGKGYSIVAMRGAEPKKAKGSTHKVVWNLLEKELPSSVLLSTIISQRSYKWYISLREEINYRTPRFKEPVVPAHFAVLDKMPLSDIIELYWADKDGLYAFDADHAALAFPIECLKQAKAALRRVGCKFDNDSWDYLAMCLGKFGMGQPQILRLLGEESFDEI